MTEIEIGGSIYRRVPLEPNLVDEYRRWATIENAGAAVEWTAARQRSIVQLALRRLTADVMPFCGPHGGLELERQIGPERLVILAQQIATEAGIFDDENSGGTDSGAAGDDGN